MLEIIETQGNSGFVTLRALLPLEKDGPILTLLRSIYERIKRYFACTFISKNTLVWVCVKSVWVPALEMNFSTGVEDSSHTHISYT